DPRVFVFLEEIYALPNNNPIQPFEVTDEITNFLKEQWAGLFQRFLQERTRMKEYEALESLRATADTLNRMVSYLVEQREKGDKTISDILLSSHPVFDALRKITRTPYRIFFTTHKEMEEWLNARSYVQVIELDLEEGSNDYEEWQRADELAKKTFTLKIKRNLFDENQRLRILSPDEKIEDYVSLETSKFVTPEDEDLPF
ncbi:MAG: hypothetical protein PHI18_10575, partial [bacterium]|nr:hypothetical protein [bacterium]